MNLSKAIADTDLQQQTNLHVLVLIPNPITINNEPFRSSFRKSSTGHLAAVPCRAVPRLLALSPGRLILSHSQHVRRSGRVWSRHFLGIGTIVNRAYDTHSKNLPGIYLPNFSDSFWSYLPWSFVIAPYYEMSTTNSRYESVHHIIS